MFSYPFLLSSFILPFYLKKKKPSYLQRYDIIFHILDKGKKNQYNNIHP